MSKVFEILQNQAEKLDSVETSLIKIAASANENRKTLESIDNHLQHLCGVLANAATKDRIPTKVFIYTIFTLGGIFVLDKFVNSGTNLHADTRGIHIEQQPKAE